MRAKVTRSRKRLYDPASSTPFKLSRSKIELFIECPCCFYLDRRRGIGRPPGFPFNLNSAVDALLKKEFDSYRAERVPHPLMQENGIDAIPFSHEQLDDWRKNQVGVRYLHEPTQFLVHGAVDDVWIDPQRALHVVDYKATSKSSPVSLDADWQRSYKRQMEIYQWLLRGNGFTVSSTGYFVYCNGRRSAEQFDARLDFDISVLPYDGDDNWIESTLVDIVDCLRSDQAPMLSEECSYCNYRTATALHLDSMGLSQISH